MLLSQRRHQMTLMMLMLVDRQLAGDLLLIRGQLESRRLPSRLQAAQQQQQLAEVQTVELAGQVLLHSCCGDLLLLLLRQKRLRVKGEVMTLTMMTRLMKKQQQRRQQQLVLPCELAELLGSSSSSRLENGH
jgi:hypothetical protein